MTSITLEEHFAKSVGLIKRVERGHFVTVKEIEKLKTLCSFNLFMVVIRPSTTRLIRPILTAEPHQPNIFS